MNISLSMVDGDVGLPRVEAAHMMIALHATVHNGLVALLRNAFLRDCRIYPVGEAPLLRRYLTPLNRRACVVQDGVFEGLIEDSVVQKDIRIVEPSVEMPFD
jgi:hypothetical protein